MNVAPFSNRKLANDKKHGVEKHTFLRVSNSKHKTLKTRSVPLLLKDKKKIHSQIQYIPSAFATLILQYFDIQYPIYETE